MDTETREKAIKKAGIVMDIISEEIIKGIIKTEQAKQEFKHQQQEEKINYISANIKIGAYYGVELQKEKIILYSKKLEKSIKDDQEFIFQIARIENLISQLKNLGELPAVEVRAARHKDIQMNLKIIETENKLMQQEREKNKKDLNIFLHKKRTKNDIELINRL